MINLLYTRLLHESKRFPKLSVQFFMVGYPCTFLLEPDLLYRGEGSVTLAVLSNLRRRSW